MRKLALALIGPFLFSGSPAAEPEGEKQAITLDELRQKFEVIGYLGIPLGQVATIDAILRVGGRGSSKARRGKPFLEIIAVDGKPLISPVGLDYGLNPQVQGSALDFRAAQKKSKRSSVGKTFRLLVHESAGFDGVPRGLPAGVVPAGVGFGLSSNLSVWKIISSDICGSIDLNDPKALERMLATTDGDELTHISAALTRMDPGPSRDRAVAVFARAIAKEDAESAKAWAESITDKDLRKSTRDLIAQ